MANIFVLSIEWYPNEVCIIGKTETSQTVVYRVDGVYPRIMVNAKGNTDGFISELEMRTNTKLISHSVIRGGRELVGYGEEVFIELVVGNYETRSRIVDLIDAQVWCPGVYIYNGDESPLLRFQLLHGIKCNRWCFISTKSTLVMAPQFRCVASTLTTKPRLTMMTLAWINNEIACIVSDEEGTNQQPPRVFPSAISLVQFIQNSDIDILVTHEGSTGDLQKIVACNLTLSRIQGRTRSTWGVPGRIHVDVSRYNGLETNRRSPNSMEAYLTTATTTMNATSKCRAILQLLSSNNIISSMFICSELSNLPPQRVVNTAIGAKVEGVLAEKLHEFGIYKMSQASLSRKFGDLVTVDRATVKRAGGLQLDPVGGIYRMYSLLLDFASMYPSIVIVNNLCYTTLDLSPPSPSPSSRTFIEKACDAEGIGGLVDLNPDEDGGLPAFTNNHRGILPQMQEEFFAKRAAIREKVAYGKEKIDLDNTQKFYKLLGNAAIGLIGQTTSSFFLHKLYLTITRLGRSLLSQTVHWIKTYYVDLKVVYGNTDSVFISEFQTPEMALEVGKRICSEISSPQLVLKLESVLKNLVLVSKKKNRYLALDNDTGSIVIKGFEFVAKNSPAIFNTIGTDICSLALNGENYTKRAEHYRELFHSKHVNPSSLISVVGNALEQINCRESLDPEELKFSVSSSSSPLVMLAQSRAVSASLIFDRARVVDWNHYKEHFETLVQTIHRDILGQHRPLKRSRPVVPAPPPTVTTAKCVFCGDKGQRCVPTKWFGYCCHQCSVMSLAELYSDQKKRLGELLIQQQEILDMQCNVCTNPYPEFDIETCTRYLCHFRGQRHVLTKKIEHVHSRLRLVQCVCCLGPLDDFIAAVPFKNGLKHKACTAPRQEV